ncbi:MAG: bifunctional 5,10-methylenetetrahydrofolate dehydrogenase/5,10-methenyltetrahydrofolate cyclohydrolase [Acidimicrobiia bacterium]|nr:bifunctional 5,10-methylenetetrahydrofolate dehydrogenase/5,10-methenyltetrahydrofolate cyclohydrolase [Acidimicrobiia bacterium]
MADFSAAAGIRSHEHKHLDGRVLAQRILDESIAAVGDLKSSGWATKIVSVTIGAVPAVDLYVRNQRRAADKTGILFEERRFPSDISEAEALAAIGAMNVDPSVTGIIVQRPVPDRLSIKFLQSAIHPLKDIEGMHPTSIGNIVYRELELAPCTALAAVELLRATGLDLRGLEVVIVGHSEIVGKPIAFLLMAEGATVTVCHHMTRNLSVHSRQADAVFVAVGKPGLLTGAMIKPGAAVIDVGINQIAGADGTAKTVGDADYPSCAEVAGWITPVPGGVGPVTVAILMRNAVVASRRQRDHYRRTFAAANS